MTTTGPVFPLAAPSMGAEGSLFAEPTGRPAIPELRRELGTISLGALAASMMLGSGIFFGPSLTAREFPNTATVLFLWSVGGIVALCGAFAFGRLAAMHPLSGGPYVYVRKAYGAWAAFLFAWTSLVIIAPTAMAAVAQVFANHVGQISALSPLGTLLLSFWALAAVTFFNILGVKTGGSLQTFLTGLKILLVLGLIALLLFSSGGSDAEPVTGGGRLGFAFTGILFAIGGWEYAVLASEEVRDPKKTIPRALFLGTLIVVVLYLLIVWAYLFLLGPSGVARSTALAPEAAEAAVAGSSKFVAIAVAVSAVGTLNAIILLGPRATFAVARDGYAPPALARVSARWGTPVAAILLQTVLASVYLTTGAFETIAAYTIVGTGVFIVLSAVALPRLRRMSGIPRRPRDRWENVAAYVVAAAFGLFILNLCFEDPRTAAIGLGLVLSGLLVFGLLRVFVYRPTTVITTPETQDPQA